MQLQYINDECGTPQYVVLPVAEYRRLVSGEGEAWESIPYETKDNDTATVPGEVVNIMIDEDVSLLAAWRIYRGLSQAQAAEKAGVKQSAVSQYERKGNRLQAKTIELFAGIYGISPAQLDM